MRSLPLPLLAASLMLAASTLYADDRCKATALSMRTEFPADAIEKRMHGVVRLGIRLNEEGQVTHASIIESSGHFVLDRAALRGARRYWRFRLDRCDAGDVAHEQVVAVTYKRPVGPTVSGTLDRKAVARIRDLHEQDNCEAQKSHEMTVFACRTQAAGVGD
jgi:TonB family protein